MKMKFNKGIYRKNSQKWLGWTILDFYHNLNQEPSIKEENLLKILVENFFLLEEIQTLKEES